MFDYAAKLLKWFNKNTIFYYAPCISQLHTCRHTISFLLFSIFCRDLGYNEIVEFPRIQNERLTYYHLEANNLTYADRDVFSCVPNVRILKLAYNALKMHNDSLKLLKWLREL